MASMIPQSNERWVSQALCVDEPLERFFESYEKNAIIAKRTDMFCYECPVGLRCLEFAISNQATGCHFGIYLVLGKYAKNRNRHKTPEESIKAQKLIEEITAKLKKQAQNG